MKKPRQRAAHLGRFKTSEGVEYVATFRDGWILFKRWHGRGRKEAMQLADVYRLAGEQKLFAFIP